MNEDEKIIVLSQEGLPIRAFSVKATTPEAIEEARRTIVDDRRKALKHAFCTLHPGRTLDSVHVEDVPNVTTEVISLSRF